MAAAGGAQAPRKLRFCDIGANLLDPQFQGNYRGKQKHAADLGAVIERAQAAGVEKIMVTAGNLEESRAALALCMEHEGLFCTVGVHPTRTGEFEEAADADAYEAALLAVAQQGKAVGKVVAIGECGLDYDRLQFASKEVQLKHFARHLRLARATSLPLFLHNRASAADLASQLRAHAGDAPWRGVVHSFDGSLEEAQVFLDMGLGIGLNGCSLKTEANLAVAAELPIAQLHLETDAPWCGIRPSHAGSQRGFVSTKWYAVKKPDRWEEGKCVKDRCEPCHIVQVCEVVAGARGQPVEEVAQASFRNSMGLFFPEVEL